jgi:PadR family transcriptional regulator, regulatory protein PadR
MMCYRAPTSDLQGRRCVGGQITLSKLLSRFDVECLKSGTSVPEGCIIRALSLANGVYSLPKPNSAQTALDLLVLTVLDRRGPLHGYGIATAIENLSQEVLRVEEGSLYPALHRMEELEWIAAEWKMTETNRRARFYRLTKAGKKQLLSESERWASFSAGVSRVLRLA